jgi:polyisoprenoid-binding protein YceI
VTRDNRVAWVLDDSDGELLVRTGVAGRAAKMGHRLTLAMRDWRATVQWSDDKPVEVGLTVEVGSLDVVRGDGGLTPLSGPEKILVRTNALRSLDVRRFPRIEFAAKTVEPTDHGYRLTGKLTIHGKSRTFIVEVGADDLGDSWSLSGEAVVRQTDFGIKPYSQLVGSLKVADEVTVSLRAQRVKDSRTKE